MEILSGTIMLEIQIIHFKCCMFHDSCHMWPQEILNSIIKVHLIWKYLFSVGGNVSRDTLVVTAKSVRAASIQPWCSPFCNMSITKNTSIQNVHSAKILKPRLKSTYKVMLLWQVWKRDAYVSSNIWAHSMPSFIFCCLDLVEKNEIRPLYLEIIVYSLCRTYFPWCLLIQIVIAWLC